MDNMRLSYALEAVVQGGSQTEFTAVSGDIYLKIRGSGFEVDSAGRLVGGVATHITYEYGPAHGGPFTFDFDVPSVPLMSLARWRAGRSRGPRENFTPRFSAEAIVSPGAPRVI